MSICHLSTQESKNVVQQVSETKVSSAFSVDSLSAGGKKILDKYGSLIGTYHLIVPESVAAVRIWVENKGNANSYVSKTGEAGLLQMWPWARTKYKVTNWADPAENLRGGFQMWQDMTTSFIASIAKSTGVTLSYADPGFWAIGQLNTMIGSGATAALVKAFGSWSGIQAATYGANADSQLRALRGSFGTQSAACVAHRIVAADHMFQAASQLGLGGGGILTLALAAVGGYFLMQYLKSRGVF